MDVVLLADPHELEEEITVPAGDVLIVAGDWTMLSRSVTKIRSFDMWLDALPHQHKLLVPGNHESYLAQDPVAGRKLTPSGTVLINEGVVIEGLRIWGADGQGRWRGIPLDTNVLITHIPPLGILDHGYGDPGLLAAVQRLSNLQLHVYGHIHGAYGMTERDGVTFVNACLMGGGGELEHQPRVLRFRR